MLNNRRHLSWFCLQAAILIVTVSMTLPGDVCQATYVPVFNRPFVNDPALLGRWVSVDFVDRVQDFIPGQQSFRGTLYLKEMTFNTGGDVSGPWIWTKGYIYHPGDKSEAQYILKDISGVTFLFMEWVTGSGINNPTHPYYVLKDAADLTPFEDVRGKDIRSANMAAQAALPATLTFNMATLWPDAAHLPSGCKPATIMENGKNPGLGVRALQRRGLAGLGINVAIIDQPLDLTHPEFNGKIAAYHDVGCNSTLSMHGPAVASLLVGEQCGVAPGARVYYVAAPSWLADAAYYAQGLDWIIGQNQLLPASQKIRVVSVSAAPSGPGSPFTKNNAQWDQAVARAEAAGIMVLDCTSNHGFIGSCFLDAGKPEDVTRCTPGFPTNPGGFTPGKLLVPTSPRTTAEELQAGKYTSIYWGSGGLSWGIPYCAGVLALGWQLRPNLTPAQMKTMLLESAYQTTGGAKIINPGAFIRKVESTPIPSSSASPVWMEYAE